MSSSGFPPDIPSPRPGVHFGGWCAAEIQYLAPLSSSLSKGLSTPPSCYLGSVYCWSISGCLALFPRTVLSPVTTSSSHCHRGFVRILNAHNMCPVHCWRPTLSASSSTVNGDNGGLLSWGLGNTKSSDSKHTASVFDSYSEIFLPGMWTY